MLFRSWRRREREERDEEEVEEVERERARNRFLDGLFFFFPDFSRVQPALFCALPLDEAVMGEALARLRYWRAP